MSEATLPALDSIHFCPKCGHQPHADDAGNEVLKEFSLKFSQRTVTVEGRCMTADEDIMIRTCPTCGYEWYEACLDAEVDNE